jgi:hypothetical protein
MLSAIVQGKVVAVALVSTALIGGTTVAMASPHTQQFLSHTMAAGSSKTATPTVRHGNQQTATPGAKAHGTPQKNEQAQQCAGGAEVLRLTAKYALSTERKSSDVRATCSLHDGTFKGTTSSGIPVSIRTIYGYGEIDQLLAGAQILTISNGDKLTNDNIHTYIANVLHTCGNTPLMPCLKTTTPTPHPDTNGNAHKKNDDRGNNENGNHNGKGKGKLASTPTPEN